MRRDIDECDIAHKCRYCRCCVGVQAIVEHKEVVVRAEVVVHELANGRRRVAVRENHGRQSWSPRR